MQQVRVRFAPSPTGPLHIGGVRTALYNYLFAKKHGGTFILRIEDTDQGRYVEGAEQYIKDALQWFGLNIDEGPDLDGPHGPYRQSERKSLYKEQIKTLLDSGAAYMAFDTTEELDEMKEKFKALGNHSPKYDASVRMTMRNSLTLSEEEVNNLLGQEAPYTIRLKVTPGETIQFDDEVRGSVSFQSVELDDKILIKSDGMPTYHFANVVDDHDMKISHVIRGEEWLSSTAHHVLLYKAFGWLDEMPKFTHLPLILKPTGKGKLSKRDGAKFGFPVFPLNWTASEDEVYDGFKEFGFLPAAVINFLAFLGWNPGTEQEIFNLDELVQVFSVDKIVKSGARFDYQKALWYNQQYILKADMDEIESLVVPHLKEHYGEIEESYASAVIKLMRERVHTLNEFVDSAAFFFEDVKTYDEKMIRKKWKPESAGHLNNIIEGLKAASSFDVPTLEDIVKSYITDNELSFGAVFPFLRIGLSGTTKGPDMFEMMSILGQEKVCQRLKDAIGVFEGIKKANA